MSSTTNGSGNLVDEFDEAFQACLNVLTKDDSLQWPDKEEVRSDMDQTVLRFIDTARQMESFFLQKRFLLSALKPELIVKEDTNELRLELVRKDELIKKHYDKISVWQSMLADLQGGSKSPAQGPPPPPPPQASTPSSGPPAASTPPVSGPGAAPPFPGPTQGPPQGQPRMQFSNPSANLQGPLAYLEKTASNIGIPERR